MKPVLWSGIILLGVYNFFNPALLHCGELSGGIKSEVRKGLSDLIRDFPDASVKINSVSGLPESIVNMKSDMREVAATKTPSAIVMDFFHQRGKQLFLMAEPTSDVRVLSERQDPFLGHQWTVRVQQTVQGIPIYGSEAAVTVNPSSGVVSLTSSLNPPPDIAVEPKISWPAALGAALNHYRSVRKEMKKAKQVEELKIEDIPRPIEYALTVFQPSKANLDDKRYHLVWEVGIGTFNYFIDANDASIVHYYRNVHTAQVLKTYDLAGRGMPGQLVYDEKGIL